MTKQGGLAKAIGRLWGRLSPRRRSQFFVLVLCMILASFAEVFSLGMVVPFLAALTAPDQVLSSGLARSILAWTPWITSANIAVWLAAVFCAFTLAAAGFRLLLLYATSRFAFALGADLSLDVYRRSLYQPYAVHISRNTSEIINGVINKSNTMTYNVVSQLLIVGSSTIMLIGLLVALLLISPAVTIAAATAFVVIYASVLIVTRAQVARDGKILARESTLVHKALQEGLGGIRDVLLDNTQEVFSDIYRISDRKVRAAQGRQILVAGSPRFLVEGLGMVAIAILAVVASGGGSDPTVVPVLGALALGAQRLLPIVQQLYSGLVSVRGSEEALWDSLELLEQPLPEDIGEAAAPIPFARSIELHDVGFRYSAELPLALNSIDLTIRKGERIGVFGPTGGGKSTLLDILMGLLMPGTGDVRVDGTPLSEANLRGWQRHVAHVPQSIFLADTSVAENIAFGQPAASIDFDRVREAAKIAQILPVIDRLPAGFDTPVGERGIRLSGGQRQRLGIARALYKQADVIVFDEATSALDSKTEEELMGAIQMLSQDLTIVMVAHRLSTLRDCDRVVEIADGQIRRIGAYDEILSATR